MGKNMQMILVALIAIFISVMPLIIRGLDYSIILSFFLMWLTAILFIYNTQFVSNEIVNAVAIGFIISLPTTTYIIFSNVVGFLWTEAMTVATAALIGLFQKKVKLITSNSLK